jgi:hypothetical protein
VERFSHSIVLACQVCVIQSADQSEILVSVARGSPLSPRPRPSSHAHHTRRLCRPSPECDRRQTGMPKTEIEKHRQRLAPKTRSA